MSKDVKECLGSMAVLLPLSYILLDQTRFIILLIGMAAVLVFAFLMFLFCILLDAIIGYENLGEYGSNDRDYEYLIEEYSEQYR